MWWEIGMSSVDLDGKVIPYNTERLTVDNVLRVHAHYTLNTSFADFEKRAGAL
jgi:hypothetical protein